MTVFACMRVKEAIPEIVASESVQKLCARCEEAVWMSPATCTVYNRKKKREIVCTNCLALPYQTKLSRKRRVS